MTSAVHTERPFEDTVEHDLLAAGWSRNTAEGDDRKLALDAAELLALVDATQPRTWQVIARCGGDPATAPLRHTAASLAASARRERQGRPASPRARLRRDDPPRQLELFGDDLDAVADRLGAAASATAADQARTEDLWSRSAERCSP